MSSAAGIDLGGTKIEAQIFDADWRLTSRRRWPTPTRYDALLTVMAEAVQWCEAEGGSGLPVGIAAAGLVHRATGLALTANLPASGKPFPANLAAATGRPLRWINDCRALALSEALLGAAREADPALAIIFGTGLAGGVVTRGALMRDHAGIGGEFGHFALAALPMMEHRLPILVCGCGRRGCAETYLSAPGLSRIAFHVTGRQISAEMIVAGRAADPGLDAAWAIWLDLVTEFLVSLCMTVDPAVIVLGGGLSRAEGLVADLERSLGEALWKDFARPAIHLAQGGDASGARGAALAALEGGSPACLSDA